MSTVKREPATLITRDWNGRTVVNGVIYGLFGVYLLLVIVAHANGSVRAWQLAASAVVLGAILGCRLALDTYQDARNRQLAMLSVIGVAFVVLAVLYQSSSPGLGLGSNRSLALGTIFVLTVAFLLLVTDAGRYTIVEWAAIGCFVVVAGIYLARTLAFDPSSTQSRWPLWAAVVMGSNLLVIPRLIPERVFLWFLPRVAAVVVLLGLVTYAVGDYSLWIFEVRQWSGSPSVPGIETDVTTLQSIFSNPNSFGLLAFAGVVAAFVEFHRSVVARRPLNASVAVVLGGICGVGLFLSNARAAMLAAAVAVAIYGVYALGGRLTVPVMVVSSAVGVVGFVAGMYGNVIDVSASGRFELWAASAAAIRDGPLLFGYGNLSAANAIEPYLASDTPPLPHNAYLTVLIQTGFVGGLAYLGLVAGSVAVGTIEYRDGNVAMLAFAIGWAVHQFFESYTLFGWSMGAMLATLAIGYLLFEDRTI